jgi:hypothetical protein
MQVLSIPRGLLNNLFFPMNDFLFSQASQPYYTSRSLNLYGAGPPTLLDRVRCVMLVLLCLSTQYYLQVSLRLFYLPKKFQGATLRFQPGWDPGQ